MIAQRGPLCEHRQVYIDEVVFMCPGTKIAIHDPSVDFVNRLEPHHTAQRFEKPSVSLCPGDRRADR